MRGKTYACTTGNKSRNNLRDVYAESSVKRVQVDRRQTHGDVGETVGDCALHHPLVRSSKTRIQKTQVRKMAACILQACRRSRMQQQMRDAAGPLTFQMPPKNDPPPNQSSTPEKEEYRCLEHT